MKTVVAIIIGAVIVLGVFFGMSSSGNLVLDNRTVLKSPKVNTTETQNKINVSNTSNNINSKQNNLNNTNNTNNLNNSNSQTNDNPMSQFTALIQEQGLLYGKVSNGAQIIIPCTQGKIVNGQLVVPEYYVNMPWEKFTDYITANGDGSFTINEFYNGKKTGEFDLQEGKNDLIGKFTHISNGAVSQATFVSVKNYSQVDKLSRKPFYIGVIGQTAVTLTNEFNGQYTEYYHGDKHLLTVVKQNNSSNNGYNIQLNEYYQNKLTGEYFLNDVGNDTYTGIFIKNPNSQNPIKSTVGLTGSYSPFSV